MNCAKSRVTCDKCKEREWCPIYRENQFLKKELRRITEDIIKKYKRRRTG